MDSGGYTKFPNDLFDWLLAKTPELSKREIVVLLAVIRNTIGWNRSESLMSCRFISKATGLDHGNVSKAVHQLEESGLLLVDRSSGTAVISLNAKGVVKSTTGCCQNDNRGVVKPTTEALSNQQQERCQIDNKEIKIKDILNTNKKAQEGTCEQSEPDLFSLVH